MQVTQPLTEVDKALRCVCLRWATGDEVDRTLNIQEELRNSHIEVGEWYDLIPFSSIVSTVQVLRSNVSIQPFTQSLPWVLHRFYLNRFFIPKGELLPDDCSDATTELADDVF